MDNTFKGKTAVVSGASRGIGLAIVRELADRGANVVGGARTTSPELAEATPHVCTVDLGDPAGPERLVDHALDLFGRVDILVNNVSSTAAQAGGFLSVDDQAWDDVLDIAFLSAVRATRAAMPSLLEHRGAVINIGSVNARLALPHLVAYSAAKAALTNLGKALAEEFGPQGVRVNTISPGPVLTGVWTDPGSTGEALAQQAGVPLADFLEQIPANLGVSTGSFTAPEEVAALVAFLASGEVPNISGSDLVIDGGMLKTA
ncbi:NAD(P)-dependent dehydrogenase, short-chain alcohol dehydrogenase family [Saccharopolyspora shandongensis]|uniref:NAD(P)-dependent dehydrogenase, short-chain alcohol dehydrogenase family n=1 Tax=Saccharopolyspora shandongensis TaxID=418495 RepID=A0A1H2R9D3_9PSEU|nr:SDR family oxidoreductase [Saccharopolyspora shandongensis]SDW15454.1 NAD(P)-dependent dehydrogenase, short-chain alcohol dehydrogenase family [Saccharopolyspora shandongensis]